jgi:hypothetical protein
MRLISSDEIVDAAEKVLRHVIDAYAVCWCERVRRQLQLSGRMSASAMSALEEFKWAILLSRRLSAARGLGLPRDAQAVVAHRLEMRSGGPAGRVTDLAGRGVVQHAPIGSSR